jgi:rubrerythrin
MLSPVGTMEDEAILRRLVTALEEEMKSHSTYKAYALKADQEGLHGIASLFRATARAEQIHANNHARVIRHMGGEALADPVEPHVDSTGDNLKSALIDQRFEIEYLYPTFLNDAISLFESTAIRSFTLALEADKSHYRLYSDAIARLNSNGRSSWASSKHDFFVCALCGYTAQNPESENCPACNFLWEKFETIQ